MQLHPLYGKEFSRPNIYSAVDQTSTDPTKNIPNKVHSACTCCICTKLLVPKCPLFAVFYKLVGVFLAWREGVMLHVSTCSTIVVSVEAYIVAAALPRGSLCWTEATQTPSECASVATEYSPESRNL